MRTFGIEIECISKISRTELAEKIRQEIEPLGHTISVDGWRRDTDNLNRTNWVLKTDGSLTATAGSNYIYTLELVSPVLSTEEDLVVLQAVCGVLVQYCTVNRTCGLHIHHGVTVGEVAPILRGWMKVEEVVYKCLPNSRRENHYCQKLSSFYRTHSSPVPNTIAGVRRWWRSAIGTRYVGLNLESFWLRGTLEVRCAAGSVEYEKIANWYKVTLAIIEAAIAGRIIDTVNDIDSLTSCLQVAAVVTGAVTVKKCYASKKVLQLFEGLDSTTPKAELIRLICEAMPHLKMVSVETAVSDWRSWKRSVEQYHAQQAAQIMEQAPARNNAGHLEWLRNRYQHFNPTQEA